MSEFGNYLGATIKNSGITSKEMAARLGADPSQVSRWVRGGPGVNVETLAKIVSGISDDPKIRAGLLEAYFRDQALPEMKEWVRVTAPAKKGGRVEEETYARLDEITDLSATLRRLALPTSVIRSLQQIVTAMPGHTSLQDLVEELASFTRDALTD